MAPIPLATISRGDKGRIRPDGARNGNTAGLRAGSRDVAQSQQDYRMVALRWQTRTRDEWDIPLILRPGRNISSTIPEGLPKSGCGGALLCIPPRAPLAAA